jgi:hypothetical protein
MSKYLLDEQALEREIIILLSIVNASQINHKALEISIEKNYTADILYGEWNIMQNFLISIAIRLRIIDDMFQKEKEKYEVPFDVIGSLVEGDKSSELIFRNACNKIIHAMNFQPSVKQESDTRNGVKTFSYFEPLIKLSGIKENKEWKAEIDLQKFLISALALTHAYDESWKISSRSE